MGSTRSVQANWSGRNPQAKMQSDASLLIHIRLRPWSLDRYNQKGSSSQGPWAPRVATGWPGLVIF
ncbi:MAG: hypothetical protein ACKOAH_04325, partial [Pirellula sp.]